MLLFPPLCLMLHRTLQETSQCLSPYVENQEKKAGGKRPQEASTLKVLQNTRMNALQLRTQLLPPSSLEFLPLLTGNERCWRTNRRVTQILSVTLGSSLCRMHQCPGTNIRSSSSHDEFEYSSNYEHFSHQGRVTESWVDEVRDDWVWLFW